MSDMPRDLARSIFQVLFVGGLIAVSFWILQPFLLSMIWATTIVVATWPLLLRIKAWLGGRRSLAVAAMTVALLLVLLVPLALAVTAIVQNADRIIGWAKSLTTFSIPPPPDWLGRVPLVGAMLATQWEQVAAVGPEGVSAYLAPYARTLVGWFVTQIGNVGIMAAQFVLTVIICAILYVTGDSAAGWVSRFARRLDEARGEASVALAAQAIRAVALGVVVTALVQSALGGIGLAVTGVPYAAVLATLMFILSVAQVGVGPVLIPAVVWMYWKGDAVWGTVLLVWAVPVFFLDNLLRPMLIKRGAADLPLLLIFVGVIGGLIGFGIIGLFIGPVVLAVGYTLLAAWVAEGEGGTTAPDAGSRLEE
jgi:predicted PurR-regulated permease PerM